MKIDFTFYEKAKPDFVKALKRKDTSSFEKIEDELSLYCACFGLPVIVAIDWCISEFPQFKVELEKKREKIVEFYGYKV